MVLAKNQSNGWVWY